MNSLPLISIITPSYNQGKFIRNTIESVLNQKYPYIEYIIIDGGSSDNTLEIIKEYGDKIKWISEKDNGQSDAIHKGFSMAQGDIIGWLNSDDIYLERSIERVVNYFSSHPESGLVYGEGYLIDEFGKIKGKFLATQDFDEWALVHVWDYIMQPSAFFKRDVYFQVEGLDTSLNWCMDWDLWIRISKHYHVGYLNEFLACSREYEDTKTNTGGISRFFEIVKIMRKYGQHYYPPGFFLYGSSTLITITNHYPIINKIIEVFAYCIQRFVFRHLSFWRVR